MRAWSTLFLFLAGLAISCGDTRPTAPTSVATNYQGVWNGGWTSHECRDVASEQVVGTVCGSLGIRRTLRLTLMQDGRMVQGSLVFGGFVTAASGSVESNGMLSLAAHGQSDSTVITVTSWRSMLYQGSMSGVFAYTVDPDPATGRAVTRQAGFQDVMRSVP